METLDFNDLISPTFGYQPKDGLDFGSFNTESFVWEDDYDTILDSLMSSINANLDSTSPDVLGGSSGTKDSDLEIAKEDFDKVLNQWTKHLGNDSLPRAAEGLDEVAALPFIESLAADLLKDGVPVPNVEDVFRACQSASADASAIRSSTTQDAILSPNTQAAPALEATDVTSLLEQFEASEATLSLQDAPRSLPDKPKRARKPRTASARFTFCAAPRDPAIRAYVQSKPKAVVNKPSSEMVTKHKLPLTQLPRFSIILKRDPQVFPPLHSQTPEIALRDHDYCAVIPPTVVTQLPEAPASELPRQVSLLKTISKPIAALAPRSTSAVPPESLYSKLPDYYTSIVPPITVKREGALCGQDGKSESPGDDAESVYDKLPSYLTTFATATFLNSSPSLQNCCTKAAEVGKTSKLLGARGTFVLKKAAKTSSKGPIGNRRKIEAEGKPVPECQRVEYKAWRTKSRSRSPDYKVTTSGKKDAEKQIGQRGRQQTRSRDTCRRHTSSRSPSHSESSRSQSRSCSPSSSAVSSRSASSNSSSSSSSSSSVSGSRSRSPLRRNVKRSGCQRKHSQDIRSRSQGRLKYDNEERKIEEQKKQIEDRRVVHVGNVKVGTTKMDLMKRFRIFGPIEDITLHFRERNRDCFGFITFTYTCDAFEALEHGNDDPSWPQYELSLGGRRLFCLENYSDLDSLSSRKRPLPSSSSLRKGDAFDFDDLLKAAKDEIRPKQS